MSYRATAARLRAEQLHGFFDGWLVPPEPEGLLAILKASHRCVVAIDPADDRVVGFATAITDATFCAYISLLEVRLPYRSLGIGAEIVRRLLSALEGLYMVDVCCDAELVGFYSRFGMQPVAGAGLRRPQHLSDVTHAS